jgi:hypothetical protein
LSFRENGVFCINCESEIVFSLIYFGLNLRGEQLLEKLAEILK